MTFAAIEAEIIIIDNTISELAQVASELQKRKAFLNYKVEGMKNHLVREIHAKPNSDIAVILAEVEKDG